MSEPEEEKPLHVRVAEALGWHRIHGPLSSVLIDYGYVYEGHPPGPFVIGSEPVRIPRYDTNGAVAGPLIEKYELNIVAPDDKGWQVGKMYYSPGDPKLRRVCITNKRLLTAICECLLHLGSEGAL